MWRPTERSAMSVPTTRTSRSPFSRSAWTSAAVPGAPAAETRIVVTSRSATASAPSGCDRRPTRCVNSSHAGLTFTSSATSAPPSFIASQARSNSNDMHSYECSLSCMKKSIEPTRSRSGGQLVLAPAEHEAPAAPEILGNHPAGIAAGRDDRAALPVPEGAGLVLLAGDLGQVDRVQLAGAVPLERQEEERSRDSVADPGLDGDHRLHLTHEPVEAEAPRRSRRAR